MSTLRKGFTLVEILIVVVILGILAAIVVPQFASASQDAIKSALNSQMQTITAQVELYRVQNAGSLPHNDADPLGGANHNGWGVLVANSFLKNEPRNGYTNSSDVTVQAGAVTVGTTAVAPFLAANPDAATLAAAPGWVYSDSLGSVYANGYNANTNLLANEAGYAVPTW